MLSWHSGSQANCHRRRDSGANKTTGRTERETALCASASSFGSGKAVHQHTSASPLVPTRIERCENRRRKFRRAKQNSFLWIGGPLDRNSEACRRLSSGRVRAIP